MNELDHTGGSLGYVSCWEKWGRNLSGPLILLQNQKKCNHKGGYFQNWLVSLEMILHKALASGTVQWHYYYANRKAIGNEPLSKINFRLFPWWHSILWVFFKEKNWLTQLHHYTKMWLFGKRKALCCRPHSNQGLLKIRHWNMPFCELST